MSPRIITISIYINDLEATINKEPDNCKTNCVIFHPFNKPINGSVTLKIRRKATAGKRYVKYLGILIDSTLTWKHHIGSLLKHLSRSNGVLTKIRS